MQSAVPSAALFAQEQELGQEAGGEERRLGCGLGPGGLGGSLPPRHPTPLVRHAIPMGLIRRPPSSFNLLTRTGFSSVHRVGWVDFDLELLPCRPAALLSANCA